MKSATWQIAVLLLPIVATSLLSLGYGAIANQQSARSLEHIDTINRKLDAAQELEGAAARYGLRVAQVLYEERDQQADLRMARLDMERHFVRLGQEARAQAAAAPSGTETRELLTDVENIRRMLELYHAIDLSAARAFVLARDGNEDGALEAYRRDVEFRLTTEFASLLDNVLAEGQQRLSAGQAAWATQVNRNVIVFGGLGAALLATILLSSLLIARHVSASRPALVAEFEHRAEELRIANRQLRENDAKRAQFLADVSHELRTPLTILRGEADVALLARSEPNEQRRALELIQDQAAELAQLLDDLISFARSNAEPQALALKRILFDDLLAAAVGEGETLAEPREVSISLLLADKGQWIDADRRRLKQALTIGLDNAINHSPPGTTIEVELTRSGQYARASIRDHGTGLSEDDQTRVFERFYRGTNSGNSFGLGIGLAIAKGILEQHGGDIALAHCPDGGAMLTIDLPLSKEIRP